MLRHCLPVLLCAVSCWAADAPKAATVPITLDHNRVVIDVQVRKPDGSLKRVRAWVDTGNPDLWITSKLAQELGLEFHGTPEDSPFGKVQEATAPRGVIIGGMEIPFEGINQSKTTSLSSIGPGMYAVLNLPSSILRRYDVVFDYPGRQFTIAEPGSVTHRGTGTDAMMNAQTALIMLPAKVAGQTYNVGLDTGASYSFLSEAEVEKWRKAHPPWPHVTGALGGANIWGLAEEANWELLRIPRIDWGPVSLTEVGVAGFPKKYVDWLNTREPALGIGLFGGNALKPYRVEIDYANHAVYFEKTGQDDVHDMDLVGLTLRPEADESYTVLAVAQHNGKPSVPQVQPGDKLISVDDAPIRGATMGQVVGALRGRPGQKRKLVLERKGQKFTVEATVMRFM